jgi:hypothetical protein
LRGGGKDRFGRPTCQAYRQQHGCDFISAMPTNLYGPGDNFDLESAHVLPAIMRRFQAAALADDKVTIWGPIWGTGTPRRAARRRLRRCARVPAPTSFRYEHDQCRRRPRRLAAILCSLFLVSTVVRGSKRQSCRSWLGWMLLQVACHSLWADPVNLLQN